MLNSYLHKYADSLDAVNYRVCLKKRMDYTANQSFLDGDYWSTGWFAEFWPRFFHAKLKPIGLRIAPGARVLDCCCGQGYLGNFFERRFGAQVIFFDLSQAQLYALLKRRQLAFKNKATACTADLLSLPFQSHCFDWVVGNSFLHHLHDVPAALIEIYRILKQGGTVIFFHEPSTTSIFWDSFPLSLLKNTTPTEDQVGFTDLWMFTPDDLWRLIQQAGFVNIKVLGTGILSAVFLNWYILTAIKMNWRSRFGVYPAYLLRSWFNRIDISLQSAIKTRISPSLMVIATK